MSMPALQPMIASIGKTMFRRIMEKISNEVVDRFDWELDGDAFSANAFSVLSGEDVKEIRERVFPCLYDIHTLSENPKESPRYYQCIVKGSAPAVRKKWFDEFGLGSPAIQTMVAWIMLEDRGLFENLLGTALSKTKEANGGAKYYLKGNYDGKAVDPNGKFKDELKSFLKSESGVDLHVSVEMVALKKYARYTVTTDPFPSNKQHFSEESKDKDILKTHLAQDVECFYVSLYRTSRCCYFQIKCDYTQKQRDIVADFFARHVLRTQLGVKPEQKRDLKAFRSRPKKFDTSDLDGFVDYRYEGVNMRLQSGGARKDVYVRRFGNEDYYDAVERSGELKDVPEEAKELLELYLEVILKTGEKPDVVQSTLGGFEEVDERREKKYLVTIKSKGFWTSKPAASESDERKIDALLERMGLRDISGDKILKMTVRK